MLIGPSELELVRGHKPLIRKGNSLMSAAVAIIMRDGKQGTEFLMMQRAKHHNDPWSGQMSFPGGKIDPVDVDAQAAAIREVREEVGVSLQGPDYVGQLDDLYGLKVDGIYTVHVSCFVFKLDRVVEITPNYEVADTVWLPLSYLNEPENTHDHFHPADMSVNMAAVMIDVEKDQVLWGLSLRLLVGLYELLELPMDVLTEKDKVELKSMDKRALDRSKLNQKMLDAIERKKL